MSLFTIGPDDALYYEYTAPSTANGSTFVFFNALTGDAGMWKTGVGLPLMQAGHGILVYNMRGQANSPFTPGTQLDQPLIISDAIALLDDIAPPKPVFVGLSIGGLFAANAALGGATCDGLVLINTLRRDGPRLRWINDAVVRLAEVGGADLMRDVLSPLIMNETWLDENRGGSLAEDDYIPMDIKSGTYNLLDSARLSNWDLPYEKLAMPTLVITGQHDRIFRDPADIATLSARLPNARCIDVDNAGHMVPIEQTDAFATWLLDFAT